MPRVLAAAGTGIVLLIGWAHWLAASVPETATIDRLRLNKAERTLTLYDDGAPVQSYPVAMSIHPTGPKRFEGDGRVPEGTYRIAFHHPGSIAHKALRLTYPNRGDRRMARQHGRSPGGRIEIHGLPPAMAWVGRAHRLFNYTLGCVAVTNDEIDEIYAAVPDGTPITVRSGEGMPGGWAVPPVVYEIAERWMGLQIPGR